MPRSVHQLRVFIASPSDLQAERTRLEKVVRELNLSLPSEAMVQLELVRWETHTYPSFGESPQAVINEQIGSDCDIFIGILWSKGRHSNVSVSVRNARGVSACIQAVAGESRLDHPHDLLQG